VEKLEYAYYAPYYLQTFLFLIGTAFWFLSETMHQYLPFWTQGEEPQREESSQGDELEASQRDNHQFLIPILLQYPHSPIDIGQPLKLINGRDNAIPTLFREIIQKRAKVNEPETLKIQIVTFKASEVCNSSSL